MRNLDFKTEYKPLWAFLRLKSRLLFDHESTINVNGVDSRQVYIGQIAWNNCFALDCDNGEKDYYCITPLFFHILCNDLPLLMITHPCSFGRDDAIPILEALCDMYNYKDLPKFVEFLKTEQCCYIVKQRQNGAFFNSVLRLDLFRLLQDSADDNGKKEFVGGVLHAAKHFDINHRLFFSSSKQFSINSLFDLVYPVAECFFNSIEYVIKTDNKISGTARFGEENHHIRSEFYREINTDVYFLNTAIYERE